MSDANCNPGREPRSVAASIYCLSKNVPPLVCYNFDIRQHVLIFFGRNVTDKVSNEKTLYYATPSNLCFCTTWQNGETRKSHFFTQMLYQCIVRIQLVAPWFLHDSYSPCCIARAVWDMFQEKGSRECHSSWTVLHAQCICTNALSSWTKNVICDVFDSVWHLLR